MKIHAPLAALVFSSTTIALSVTPALADDDHRCSFNTVAGPFGYSTSGTRIGLGPVAGAGVIACDRDGNGEGKQTVSFNGTIATETYVGTYVVDDDCTGSFTVVVTSSIPAFNRTTTVHIVWDDNTNAAHAVFANTGTIIT